MELTNLPTGTYTPPVAKKKILLLSDDLRMHSGVGTVSRNIVRGSVDKYDWVQIGGAVTHPEDGKRIDFSEDMRRESSVPDASVIVYPTNGYGNPEILRQVINQEKPDAILHFTDPRFWEWLYQMEHEIRQTMPLLYLNIWDDLPYPRWNENFYESCDLLMAISKQTYNINANVCQRKPRTDWDLTYVPHGIDDGKYYPIDENHPQWNDMENFRVDILGDHVDADFIFFFNSRNIRRKMISDAILAYRLFCDSLPKEKAKKCVFLLHTDPVDQNGTDLPEVGRKLCPDYHIAFSTGKIDDIKLNFLYNISDCGINTSSAEGFGLSCMESIMSGTPVIVNTTGGLQDQCGFTKDDGTPVTLEDYCTDWPSNSNGRYKKHGEWAFPTWPQLNLQGSPQTPYIYDSRASIIDVAKRMKEVYELGPEERTRRGKIGREWAIENGFTAQGMSKSFKESLEGLWKHWKPRTRFELIDTATPEPVYPDGIIFDSIN